MWTDTSLSTELLIFQWVVVIGASLAAAVLDLRSRRIPNRLTLPLLGTGMMIALVTGGPLGLLESAIAAIVLGLPYVLLFIYARGGGGDAKLMAALGAWLGLGQGLLVLLAVSLAGMALAGCWIWIHRRTSLEDMKQLPYGVAISAGVCLAATGVMLWDQSPQQAWAEAAGRPVRLRVEHVATVLPSLINDTQGHDLVGAAAETGPSR